MASKVGTGPPPPVLAAAALPATGQAATPGDAATTSTPSASVECCMCGDHGLARELFRCKTCHFRYQHKYCSDLYPKADSYRSCNWCLREDAPPAAAAATAHTTIKSSSKHNPNHHHNATTAPSSSNKDHHSHPRQPTPVADKPNNSHSLSSSTSTADNNSTGSSGAGTSASPATGPVKQLQRGGDYAAHLLAKPLKKLRPVALERSASEVIVRVRAAEEMGAPLATRKVAGGRHAAGGGVRGKIRRYKLLEEVSS